MQEQVHWHNIPFVRISIAWITGIVCMGNNNYFSWYIIASIVLVLLGILILYKTIRLGRYHYLAGIVLYTSISVFSWQYAQWHHIQHANNISYTNQSQWYVCDVLSNPTKTKKTIRIQAQLKYEATTHTNINTNVWLYFKDSTALQLNYGDRLLIKTKLQELPEILQGTTFKYRQHQAIKGIHGSGFIAPQQWKPISSHHGNIIKAFCLNLNKKIIQQFERSTLSNKSQGLALALIVGDRSKMDDEQLLAYQAAGIMHVMSVSGLHVGIIFLILSSLFGMLRFNKFRWMSQIIIISTIWLYAIITGLNPPVFRAALMFSLLSIGQGMKRKPPSINIVATSGFILLLINPRWLYDIGFQLSFTAVIGIILLFPYIKQWLYFKWSIANKTWDLIAVSLAAQFATLPFILYHFGVFPTYFILGNLIASPLIFMLMLLLIAIVLLGWIPFATTILVLCTNSIVNVLNESTGIIQYFPYAQISNIYINSNESIFLYTAMFSLIVYLVFIQKKAFFITLISIAFFTGSIAHRKIQAMQHESSLQPPTYSVLSPLDSANQRLCLSQ